jgi:peptide/nickel transport system permease protein
VALGVMVVTFFLTRFALVDPGRLKAREVTLLTNPPAEVVARYQQEYGTDRPVIEQLGSYVLGLLRGDLGHSYHYKELSVAQLVGAGLGTTLLMAFVTIALASVIGISLGLWAATSRRKLIRESLKLISTLCLSAPAPLVGLVLIFIFATMIGVLPTGGWSSGYPQNFRYLVMPVATLTIGIVPVIFRITRERAVEVLRDAHVEAAKSRGLGPARVLLTHVLPNCLAPTVTVIAMGLGGLLSGAVIVEMVFGTPGIGHVLSDALKRSDFPVVQAMTLLTGVVIVLCNLGSEVFNRALDPRMR